MSFSLRDAINGAPSFQLDASKGLKNNRNAFYQNRGPRIEGEYAFRSLRALIQSLKWPNLPNTENFLEPAADYPSNYDSPWSQIIQGVTHDADNWFFSRQYGLSKFPLEHNLSGSAGSPKALSVGIPKQFSNLGYDHIGDLDFFNGHLYVPLEGQPVTRVLFYNTSLELVNWAAFDAPHQTHAPWCAVNPLDGYLYTSNFDINSDEPTLFVYRIVRTNEDVPQSLESLGSFTLFNLAHNPIAISRVQGGVFSASGHLYLVSDAPPEEGGGILAFEMINGYQVARTPIDYQRRRSISVPPGLPTSVKDVALGVFTGGASLAVAGSKTITVDYEELEGITIWDADSGRAPSVTGQVHVVMNHPNFTLAEAAKLITHPSSLSELIATKQIPTTMYFKHFLMKTDAEKTLL